MASDNKSRDFAPSGRFRSGNLAAVGRKSRPRRPTATQSTHSKRELFRSIFAGRASSRAIRLVVGQLWRAAERGERWAIVEILNRFVGRPGPDGTPKIDRQTVGSDTDQAKYVKSLALDEQRALDRFIESSNAVLRGDDPVDEIQAAIDGRADDRHEGGNDRHKGGDDGTADGPTL